jgi:uncharacterized protein (TIRG00374 family)
VISAFCRRHRDLILNLFKYCLAFGLLTYVVVSNWKPGEENGLASVWDKHAVRGEPVHLGYLGLALLLYSMSLSVTLVRWYSLVRAQDLPFRMRDAARLGLRGFFWNTVLPGSVGGDLVKATGIAREQNRRTVAVATVVMDRLIAVWGMVWMVAGLGLIFWAFGSLDGAAAAQQIVRAACFIFVVSVVVWTLMGLLSNPRAHRLAARLARTPKVGHALAELWRTVWMYRCRQGSVALALVLTWVGQVGFILSFYLCALTLWTPGAGTIPSLTDHFLLVPIGLIIQAVPLFPGGAGIGEAGFGGLYALLGGTAALGVLGSLVQRVSIWIIALGGFILGGGIGSATPTPPPVSSIPVNQPAREPTLAS